MDRKIKENKYKFKTLIAFSGVLSVPGEEESFTEKGMNGFPENSLPQEFEKTENKFLIVADKYQTGFDQPKLVVMYVDKTLRGISAVQTLSRLNRCYPNKEIFILDFVNTTAQICKSFAPFYSWTKLLKDIEKCDIDEWVWKIEKYDVVLPEDVEDYWNIGAECYKDKDNYRDVDKLLIEKLKPTEALIEEHKSKDEIFTTLELFVEEYGLLLLRDGCLHEPIYKSISQTYVFAMGLLQRKTKTSTEEFDFYNAVEDVFIKYLSVDETKENNMEIQIQSEALKQCSLVDIDFAKNDDVDALLSKIISEWNIRNKFEEEMDNKINIIHDGLSAVKEHLQNDDFKDRAKNNEYQEYRESVMSEICTWSAKIVSDDGVGELIKKFYLRVMDVDDRSPMLNSCINQLIKDSYKKHNVSFAAV